MKKQLFVAEFNNGDNIESFWFVGDNSENMSYLATRRQACREMKKEFEITIATAMEWLIEVYPVPESLIKEVYESR